MKRKEIDYKAIYETYKQEQRLEWIYIILLCSCVFGLGLSVGVLL